MDKKYLASITILIKDRQSHAPEINQILTANGHLILSRNGINLQRNCVENCSAIINIIVEASSQEIDLLTNQFNNFYGVVAKSIILNN